MNVPAGSLLVAHTWCGYATGIHVIDPGLHYQKLIGNGEIVVFLGHVTHNPNQIFPRIQVLWGDLVLEAYATDFGVYTPPPSDQP